MAEIARLQKANTELRARLTAREDGFAGLLDHMANGVLVFDRLPEDDFSIAYANRHASLIFGVEPEEMTGANFLRFVHPDDRDFVNTRKSAMLSDAEIGDATYRGVRADGTVIWISTRGVAYRCPDEPSRSRSIISIRDVTDEHQRTVMLSATRDRLDQILNVIPGVFYQLSADADGKFKSSFVSENAEHVFGISSSDAMRHGYFASLALVDLETTRRAALDNANSKGIGSVVYPVRINGEVVWVRDTLRLLHNEDGSQEIIGFVADATSERRSEVLKRRMSWAQAAQARSLAVLLRAGPLDELLDRICNSVVAEPVYVLTCFCVPEFTAGHPIRVVASAGTAASYLNGIQISWSADGPYGKGPTGIAIREGIPHICQDTWTDPVFATWRSRGDQYGIRSSVTIPCSVDGKVVGALLVYASEPNAFGEEELALFERLCAEIALAIKMGSERLLLSEAQTARRHAEENLSASMQLGPGLLYRAQFSANQVKILAIHGDLTRVLHQTVPVEGGNQALANILGTPERMATILSHPDSSTLSDEYPITNPGSARQWLRNTIRIIGRDAERVEVIGYLSEVTHEKEQELHRQQVTTLLTLGELATGMAHELNQPLASILLAAENALARLQRQPLVVGELEAKLQKIVRETRRAGRLIEHTRIFARNEKEQPSLIDWQKVFSSALEILHGKARKTKVVNALPAYLPSVMGWPIAIEQMLINLIGNAVDTYEERAITVDSVVIVEGELQEKEVVLRVKDHAGGIPADVLPRIFEPFFTTKPVGHGTGLGLAITIDAVRSMSGSITARNEGDGAVFEIRLPLPAAGLEPAHPRGCGF